MSPLGNKGTQEVKAFVPDSSGEGTDSETNDKNGLEFVYDDQLSREVPKAYQAHARRADRLKEERTPEQNDTPDYDRDDFTLPDDFNHIIEFRDNVPSISHEYPDRQSRIFDQDWKGKDRFESLYYGRFDETDYSKSVGEIVLGAIFGFWHGNNRQMVAYEMENLPYDSKYSRSPAQRKRVLEIATDNYWSYCEKLSFECKLEVAKVLELLTEPTTAKDIAPYTVFEKGHKPYHKDTVLRVLNVMESEGIVTRQNSGNQIVWDYHNINDYISQLESTIEKYAMRDNDIVVIENPTLDNTIGIELTSI